MLRFTTAVSIAALALGLSGAATAGAPQTARPMIERAPTVELAQGYGQEWKYREDGGQARVGGEADAEVEAGVSERAEGPVKPSSNIEGHKQIAEQPDTELDGELDGTVENQGYGDEERYRENGGQPQVGGETDAEIRDNDQG